MPVLANLLLSLGISFVLQMFKKKPEPPKASEISEFEIAKAKEGDEIIKVFGTETISAVQVAWYGDLKLVAIKDESGKK